MRRGREKRRRVGGGEKKRGEKKGLGEIERSLPDVSVTAGSVPIPRNGFGVEADDHIKLLGYSSEDISRDPEVVTHLYTFAGPYLVLPLK